MEILHLCKEVPFRRYGDNLPFVSLDRSQDTRFVAALQRELSDSLVRFRVWFTALL